MAAVIHLTHKTQELQTSTLNKDARFALRCDTRPSPTRVDLRSLRGGNLRKSDMTTQSTKAIIPNKKMDVSTLQPILTDSGPEKLSHVLVHEFMSIYYALRGGVVIEREGMRERKERGRKRKFGRAAKSPSPPSPP
ncbi:hypothetical protein EVAR_19780_1 [Eumeta japonica]|uniref:Uncharacterized protein n=1 Tax=Eumeta variegata TaxID=151549 RepID=A0A4C1UQL9_EUMVA|nr:hypothetical protein EVAR_19780_1 [Eumeta japonica]